MTLAALVVAAAVELEREEEVIPVPDQVGEGRNLFFFKRQCM